MFKIIFDDKFYRSYEIYDSNTLNLIYKASDGKNHPIFGTDDICLQTTKIFNHDIFDIETKDNTKSIIVRHSSVKENKYIAGILICDKIYDKVKGKQYFRVIPDDKRLPDFLVGIKQEYSFSKVKDNLYIIFKYESWNGKHPIGTIVNNIGTTDNLPNFYEYSLYCKGLQISINKFTKDAQMKLREKSQHEYLEFIMKKYDIEDRSEGPNFHYAFTIDGKDTMDFDDAIGIHETENENKLSIYISNVAIWLEVLNLWESFSQRVATIYLPNQKKTMLPIILSDSLCSLVKKKKKVALTMDIHFDDKWESITNIKVKNTLIRIKNNYVYESPELLANSKYQSILNILTKYNKIHKHCISVQSSYDVITYLMIFMNNEVSKILHQHKCGIYRKLNHNDSNFDYTELPDTLTSPQKRFLFAYQSQSAQYCKYKDSIFMSMFKKRFDTYTHVTSPIRRLIDLLNSIVIQRLLGLIDFGDKGATFFDKWYDKLDYINLSMRAIRKVQFNCHLLNELQKYKILKSEKPIIEKGVVFDEVVFENGMNQYHVYFERFKFVTKYTSSNKFDNYRLYNFEIYLFDHETTMKKKIKVKYVN